MPLYPSQKNWDPSTTVVRFCSPLTKAISPFCHKRVNNQPLLTCKEANLVPLKNVFSRQSEIHDLIGLTQKSRPSVSQNTGHGFLLSAN